MRTRLDTGRYPFEMFILALCLLSGIPLLLGNPKPMSIDTLVPGWAATLWGVGLSGGAGLALVGIAWRERITGIILEQIGLVATGLASLFYVLCIVLVVGKAGVSGAAVIGGFGVACLWQWWQLERLLARIKQIARDER